MANWWNRKIANPFNVWMARQVLKPLKIFGVKSATQGQSFLIGLMVGILGWQIGAEWSFPLFLWKQWIGMALILTVLFFAYMGLRRVGGVLNDAEEADES